ncbi:hypothetical protein C0Z11_08060 [Acidipropionibacterium jensenii]|uniref:hypothetical protein n=1 Tax=Acidipropionibacterium jensenii TaxID=1749 RepID=UPI000BC36044|nr:hypothetical protein [Acidipropionibacterium jensenii]AZZ42248.1 hypothetical protein C0Z11_08060 [Acidipropionibacterium jensenii]
MTVTQTLRGLLRRWYILVVGLVVAIAVAAGVWSAVPPTYTRTSTQILLPGSGMIPSGSNPYLFVGGLAPAADIIVRGLGSKNVIEEVVQGRAGTTVQVARDQTTSGPVILITVESTSDRDAAAVLSAMNQRTASLLDSLQAEESIPERRRISVVAVSVDKRGTAEQKQRLMMTGASGAAVLALSVLVASFVDGAVLRRRRARRAAQSDEAPASDETTSDEPTDSEKGSGPDGATRSEESAQADDESGETSGPDATAAAGEESSKGHGAESEDSSTDEASDGADRSEDTDGVDAQSLGDRDPARTDDPEQTAVRPQADQGSSLSRSAASPVDPAEDTDLPDRRGDRGERAPIG